MFRVIMDLFLAGSETTSTTLDWGMLFMTEFPEIQKKCQQEIEEVLIYFFQNRRSHNRSRAQMAFWYHIVNSPYDRFYSIVTVVDN